MSEKKVLATVVNLMEHTYIRIGNNGYEKLYGSYGLTTLKDKHVTIKKEEAAKTSMYLISNERKEVGTPKCLLPLKTKNR